MQGGVPVEPADAVASLRLLLGTSGKLASQETAEQFYRYAAGRGLDLGRMRRRGLPDRPDFAALTVPSPGRSALLLVPHTLSRGVASHDRELVALVDTVCRDQFADGTDLLQCLLPTNSHAVVDLLTRCEFRLLTTLVYLTRTVRRAPRKLALPAGYHTEAYGPNTHALFAEAIDRSYIDSLDCPELTGRREVEDVIAGHKAAGEFHPSLWSVLVETETNRPVGVLLLAGMGNAASEGIELVYLALVPEARGKGLGHVLLGHAEAVAARSASKQLALAVDGRNTPALSLYRKHKLREAQSRLALVRYSGDA
ncbi:MAG: GNAT family N-acetyltransferase [Planctomycetota bacterium]